MEYPTSPVPDTGGEGSQADAFVCNDQYGGGYLGNGVEIQASPFVMNPHFEIKLEQNPSRADYVVYVDTRHFTDEEAVAFFAYLWWGDQMGF